MKNFRVFPCGECGGAVDLRPVIGRKYEFAKGIELAIPSDLPLPVCATCGELYLNRAFEKKLHVRLRRDALRMQSELLTALCEAIAQKYDVKRREIADALAVTPAYLSNIVAGRKLASASLVRLLRAYEAFPMLFCQYVAHAKIPSASLLLLRCSPPTQNFGDRTTWKEWPNEKTGTSVELAS